MSISINQTASRINTPPARTSSPNDPYRALAEMRAKAFTQDSKDPDKIYDAYVLWSVVISKEEASSKLGTEFFDSIRQKNNGQLGSSDKIIESVLWVEDISDFYPMPSNKGLKLLRKLRKLADPSMQEAELKAKKTPNEKKTQPKFTGAELAEIRKALSKIIRFPRGYTVTNKDTPHTMLGE